MKRQPKDKELEKLYTLKAKTLREEGAMAKKKLEMIEKEITKRTK